MLEVIFGPMYSGKSTALISRLVRAKIAGRKVVLFKPSIDTRYHESDVVSHDGLNFPAITVSSLKEIEEYLDENPCDIVGIDEAQFLNPILGDFLEALIKEHGFHFIVAGLNNDFKGKRFETMESLVFRATALTQLTAICVVCGDEAQFNQRIVDGMPVFDGEIVEVGGLESYESRCLSCFVEKDRDKRLILGALSNL